MGASPLRYDRLIKVLPKHKHAQTALEEAGFSKQTARTKAKRVLQATLRHQAKKVLNASPNASQNSKQYMSDIVGMSREDLFLLLRKIANQDKDYGTAVKVIAPLVREHGVILGSDDDAKNVTVPIINLGFAPVSQGVDQKTPQLIEGNVKEEAEKDG